MNFLFEVGLEEIPARMIAAAQAELARRVEDVLTRERLLSAGHEIHNYSTPRRLAVLVNGVEAAQADAQEHLTGPSWAVAFKNGEPTPAAHAFAKKAGVDVSALQKITTQKGEYVSAVVERQGRTASEILTEQLPKELTALYWPKNMYWRAGKPERFVRPIKWLLALLDHAIVSVEFAGVHAANLTYGHRILHGDAAVTVEHADDYLGVLEAAFVTADVELRRHRIRKGLDAAARTISGARWREDEPLVDTVTHLTEWPSVLLGSFETEYLALPEEVLVTVMRDHQKYFALEDAQGKLAPYFLTVLNTQADEQGTEIIRHNNERVLRARFNDARFFWTVDQKIPLVDRVEMLKAVTFHEHLGSYYDRIKPTQQIATEFAYQLNTPERKIDVNALKRAIELGKTDLTTELVKEFTELQGIVGGLYARKQGLNAKIADAIYWQYQPASINDPIPETIEGQILGLADRMATIADMLAIGLAPTGSKDPFALRRAANGVIRILSEANLPLSIDKACEIVANESNAGAAFETPNETTALAERLKRFVNDLKKFLGKERLEFYLRDVHGFAYDVVNAVLAAGVDSVPDAIARTKALKEVRDSDDFVAISAAFKRMKNILRQARAKSVLPLDRVDPNLLADPAEWALYNEMFRVRMIIEPVRAEQKYREALEEIATLRPHVDLFFDKVMVMVDDPEIRSNRLALIASVLGSFSSIADFSEIVTS